MRVNGVVAAGGVLMAAVLFVSLGFATNMPTATKKLAGDSVDVSGCDTDGVTIAQNLSSSNVSGVTVGDIAPTCGGATISLTLDNGTASRSGSAAVPSGGGSVTVALSPSVPLNDSDRIDVAILGP